MKKQTIRVLIVGDDVLDARVIADLLSEGQDVLFTVETVDGLSLVRDKLARVRYDAILLDLNLPDSEGIDSLKKLISLARDTPIIVCSATDKKPSALSALQAGAQDFLLKREITAAALTRSLLYSIERKKGYSLSGKAQQKKRDTGPGGRETESGASDYRRIERTFQQRELMLSAIANKLPAPASRVDRTLHYLFVNSAYKEWFGKKAEEVIGRTIPEVIGDEAYGRAKPYIKRVLGGQTVIFENPIKAFSGQTLYGLITYIPDVGADGKVKGFFIVINDITERKRAEEQVEHLSRVLRSVRNINQLIVKENDKNLLMQKACTILTEVSGYRMVWIGLIEQGHKRVIPVAHAGFESGYLKKVTITWDDEPTGMGPTGRAIKTRMSCTSRDHALDPDYLPWGKEAKERGYKSSFATPLVYEDRVYGALNIYADSIAFFNEEEARLMEELAQDIAFALSAIELKQHQKQSQLEIDYLKEFNENIINAMPDPIDIIDSNMVVVFQNRASRDKYGDALGKKCHQHYRKSNSPCDYCTAGLSLTDKSAHIRETRMEDGSWVEIHSLPISLPDGQQCALEIIREITERKMAEQTLRESEERYRTITENMSDTVWVADMNMKNTFISPSVTKMRGYTLDELNALPLSANVTPQSFEVISQAIAEEITPERLAQKDLVISRRMELEFYRKDGSTFWADNVITMVRNADGSPKEIIGVGRDITEHKRITDALQESEERYRRLLELAPVGIAVHSEGKIVFSNPMGAAILGAKSPEEIVGRSVSQIVHPDNWETARDRIKRMMAGEQRLYPTEDLYVRLDGSPVPVEVIATPLSYQNKPAVQVIVTDITERKRTDEELRRAAASLSESERLLKALINNMPDIAWLKDAESRYLLVNESFGRSCGISPNELVGKSDLDIWPKDLARRYREDDREVMRSGNVKIVEEPLTDKQGKMNWLETIKTPIYNEQGEVVGTVGIARDLTEHKKAEEELRQSEALFRNLFEHHAAVKMILDPDTGQIVEANEAAEKFYGWPIERLKKMKIQEINTLPPEEVKKEIEKVRSLERVHFNFQHRRADGSIRDVEVFSSKIEAKGKELLHSIIHDVTDRRRAEEALRDSEEKFRSLFQTSRDFICIIDLGGTIIEANDTAFEFFGYSPEELSGMQMRDLYVNQEDRQALVEEILKKGYVTNYEIKMKKRGGEIIDTFITVMTRRDKDGNPIGFFSSAKDITEKRKMELQLIQTEKLSAVGTMISGVAHELNNPLTSIIGNAQILAKRDVTDDVKNKLDVILKESIRSSKIVGGLLAFAREHKPERKMHNINDILMESVKLREYDLKVNNIDVRLSLSDDLPQTFIDPYQIQQVFINLINNARDAIADIERGALAIRTYREDNTVLIEFEDTGPGIPDEFINKIFDPFFTTKETGKGTGLGLSMSYGIVKEHGGTISVESKPGKGTKFIVVIPILEGTELIVDEARIPVKTPPGTKAVLVVEDEASLRDLLEDALTEGGFFVEAVSSGEDAIRLIEKREFDAVISDIKMPGISGKELYLYIQKHHHEIVEKIIFITGDVLSKDTLSFLQITNSRFIEKPFNLDALVAMVNNVLSE